MDIVNTYNGGNNVDVDSVCNLQVQSGQSPTLETKIASQKNPVIAWKKACHRIKKLGFYEAF